jgi:hypothetical protein
MLLKCLGECICAPFVYISTCCNKPKEKEYNVTQVAVSSINPTEAKPTHHRERTWTLENGKMRYKLTEEIKPAIVKDTFWE